MRSFASDNNSGIHPAVLEAIAKANVGHCVGYGDDQITKQALEKFKETFGRDSEAFLVFNGTGANVLALSAMASSFNAVICSETAHIHNDECGAPEKFAGSKLLPIATVDGKITVEAVRAQLRGIGDAHHVQPRVLSLTQATELGTVYSLSELRALTEFAHAHGLLVHMDGARIANAAASLGVSLKEVTADCGVDVLSFGGTKNGLLGGEAVVIFKPELALDFKFIRKQGAQLASKMRFASAQLLELLSNDLWRKNAAHSNAMAALLASELRSVASVQIVHKVETNAVFENIDPDHAARLKERFFFYTWNERESIVRWMASFDTTEEDVRAFVKAIGDLG